MYHLLAYSNTFAGAVNNQDATAVADGNFSIRNNHFILTEPYRLLAAVSVGATLSSTRFNIPSFNAVARHNIYPTIVGATIPANPNMDDYRDVVVQMPINEEIAIEQSAGAAETDHAFLWLGTPDWNRNLPVAAGGAGLLKRRLPVLATQTITGVANAWSADTNLVFETTLRGGVYSVIGAEAVAAGLKAFRINFPRRPLYSGRKTLPGNLGSQTYGNAPNKFGRQLFGEWGRFHTFEPPFIQGFFNAGGGVSTLLFLDLVYLGEDLSLLQAPGVTTI